MRSRARVSLFVLAQGWWVLSELMGSPRAAAQAPGERGSELATAEPRTLALHWVRFEAAESCIDGAALARDVESKLARPVFVAPREATLSVEGRAQRTEAGYRAELRMFDRGGALLGTREITSAGADCRELSEAIAVVLAVMVDPEAAMAEPAAPKTLPPAPPPEATPAPEVKPLVVVAPPPEPPLLRDRQASVFGRMAFGALPKLALGVGAAFEVAFRRLGGARLEAAGFLKQDVPVPMYPGAGTELSLLYAGLQYCPVWIETEAARVSGCAGVAGGAFLSRGHGLDTKHPDQVFPVINGTGALHLAIQLTKVLAVRAGAGVVVALRRTQLEVRVSPEEKQTVFPQGPLAAELDVGLGARF